MKFKFTFVFLYIFLIILMLEVFLYFTFGNLFIHDSIENLKDRHHIVSYVKDKNVGWKNKAGSYSFKEVDYSIEKNISENGSRFAGRIAESSKKSTIKSMYLIGDSYTHGYGLSDHETLAYSLQSKFKDYQVYNFGVGGYSICQVYLTFLDLLNKNNSNSSIVIYGFSDFHFNRALGSTFVDYRIAINSHLVASNNPVCVTNSLGQVEATTFYGSSYDLSKLSFSYSLSALADSFFYFLNKFMFPDNFIYRKTILQQFNVIAKEKGVRLILLLQDFTDTHSKNEIIEILTALGIEFVDGSGYYNKEYRLSDNHPNKILNNIWSDMVTQHLSKDVSS